MRGPATASKHTLLYFDVVRALSSQMVLVGHSLNLFLPAVFLRRGSAHRSVPYMQNLGVVLFFVLSGFLVSSSVMRRSANGSYGFRQYAIERATRILVPFVPALVLIAVADRAFFHGADHAPFIRVLDNSGTTFLANLTMLYNNPPMQQLGRWLERDLSVGPFGTAAPFWTVVIEWWIYLSFGLVALFLLGRARLRFSGAVLFLLAVAVPAASLTNGSGLVLAWLVGMTYALGRQAATAASALTHGGIAALGAASAVLSLVSHEWNFYQPMVCIGVALMVMSLYHVVATRRADDAPVQVARAPLAASFVRLLSDYSYSLYLVHFSLLVYLTTLLPETWQARWAILTAFVLANLVALGFWWTFERRYPAVRRRLEQALVRPAEPVP